MVRPLDLGFSKAQKTGHLAPVGWKAIDHSWASSVYEWWGSTPLFFFERLKLSGFGPFIHKNAPQQNGPWKEAKQKFKEGSFQGVNNSDGVGCYVCCVAHSAQL